MKVWMGSLTVRDSSFPTIGKQRIGFCRITTRPGLVAACYVRAYARARGKRAPRAGAVGFIDWLDADKTISLYARIWILLHLFGVM